MIMKNFIPRGNQTRKERIKQKIDKIYPFSVCAFSIQDDLNINLIYRSLSNFSGIEMFIVGSKQWHKGATNGLEDVVKITYFNSIHDFLEHMKKTEYNMVAVEQTENSISLFDFQHPKKPCFIFGNESAGLLQDILMNVESVVEVPMQGFHPSLNVGCCASIVMYDFVRKMNNY